MDNRSIRKLESELWESADLLRAGSKLTSNQYCMPVLGLIFLRYAYSRFKLVEAEILSNRPSRGGRVLPVEASDFAAKSALFLPKEAQYDYLVNLPANIAAAGLLSRDGHPMNSLGEVVNNAMTLVEEQSEQLAGVLPKDYTIFSDELLHLQQQRHGGCGRRRDRPHLRILPQQVCQEHRLGRRCVLHAQIPGQDDREHSGAEERRPAGN